MVEFVYGRVRARDGLNTKERQLCTLAAMSGTVVFPEFRSTIIGAMNSGASLAQIRGIFLFCCCRGSPPDYVRLICLLVAHTASGNLSGVAIDWSCLPREYHAAGLETALFSGVHKPFVFFPHFNAVNTGFQRQ